VPLCYPEGAHEIGHRNRAGTPDKRGGKQRRGIGIRAEPCGPLRAISVQEQAVRTVPRTTGDGVVEQNAEVAVKACFQFEIQFPAIQLQEPAPASTKARPKENRAASSPCPSQSRMSTSVVSLAARTLIFPGHPDPLAGLVPRHVVGDHPEERR